MTTTYWRVLRGFRPAKKVVGVIPVPICVLRYRGTGGILLFPARYLCESLVLTTRYESRVRVRCWSRDCVGPNIPTIGLWCQCPPPSNSAYHTFSSSRTLLRCHPLRGNVYSSIEPESCFILNVSLRRLFSGSSKIRSSCSDRMREESVACMCLYGSHVNGPRRRRLLGV
jgi:hypothetical protein